MNIKYKFPNALISVLIIFYYSLNANAQTGWIIQNSGTTGNLRSVYFNNVNTGFTGIRYIIGNDSSLRTTNSGTNWYFNPGLPGAMDLSFINSSTGMAVNGNIMKTTNGGISWIDQGNSRRYQVEFVNDSIGFAVGGIYTIPYFQVISRTTNGGLTWDSVLIGQGFAYQDYCPALVMYNSQLGYFSRCVEPDVGHLYSQIYKTTNGFNSWSISFYREYLFEIPAISMPAVDTVYFIADDGFSYPDTCYIYKGINDVWTIVDTTSVRLRDLYFTNALTGYAAGYSGLIIKTTNGGLNWYTLYTGISTNLNKIFFINSLTGYAVGDGGIILKTTTGGEPPHSISGTVRYQDNNQPVPSGYVKALMYDQQTHNVITVDSTGILSNGTYMLIHCPPVPLDIMAFQDDEEDNYFVPTYYVSTIYWEDATHVTPDTNLTNIDIGVYRINNTANNMHIGGGVYSAGSEDMAGLKDAIVYAKIGNVFKGYSISGGTGAYRIDSLSSGIYEVICNRMGYYSGLRPFQLTTYSVDTIDFVLSILLVSVEPNLQNIPEKYWLSQNYPNPFNPQTTIKFGLPEQSNVKLIVYDILGREVGRLFDKEFRAGEYNVTWDASRLSSGIYFYRLETNKYTETRKMVLVK